MIVARHVAACVLLSSWAGALHAQSRPVVPPPDLNAFDQYVARAARDWRVPGMAVAIVKDDSVVFAKGYGVLDLGKPAPVTEHTRFAIGSTTKAMTSAALGMLVDEGKLRWDDRVIDHLPDFRLYDPYATRELTVRDLLTHRSGLPGTDLLWTRGDYSPADMMRRLRYVRPASSFRSQWSYQNVVYAIGGAVIEKVSGMKWEAFMRARIFGPLGMTESEPLVAGIELKPNVATPHGEIRDTVRQVPIRTTDPVASAGSVWSSVSDMAKWMRFMLDSGRVGAKRLLTPATFSELITPQIRASQATYPALTLVRPHTFGYGLGWFVQDYRGEMIWMHTGSINGMSAIVGLLPDRRAGVFVLANLDHAELRHALMYKVFDLYAGNPDRDWSTELRAFFSRPGSGGGQVAARGPATGTRPSLPVERYAGSYTDSTYGDVDVTLADGSLYARFGKADLGRLEHWEYDGFRALGPPPEEQRTSVTFVPDGGGRVASLRAFGVTFARTSRPAPDYSAPAGASYTAVHVMVPTPMGHRLAATLTLPEGASRTQPVPAIVTITGSGPQDRDEDLPGMSELKLFRSLADTLTRRRIAVLRMDDRGTGGSTGDHEKATSADFAEDIRAGLAYLRTRPEIDTTRLGIVGHSEGGMIGPLVAVQEPALRAVVLMAGPSWSGRRILTYQLSNFVNQDSTLKGTRRDSALAAVPAQIDSLTAGKPWMEFFMKHDNLAVARRIKSPVLVINGATDQQVTPEQARELGAAIKAGGNKDVTVQVFPNLNHLFIYDPSGFPGGYTRLKPVVDPSAWSTVAAWLAQRLK